METRRSKDVLIVDDDEEVRRLLCAMLERTGLTCEAASHGVEALGYLRVTTYSVVLLDLEMPELDGTGVLSEMLSWNEPEERKPVILIVTGTPEREMPLLPGDIAQAIVRKPIDSADLAGIVGGCVAARQARLAGVTQAAGDHLVA
ncbi:MAG TPA: response regulator [Thermoanaerobaculia bacterium]|jgi:CheY-like chemotaxis protein